MISVCWKHQRCQNPEDLVW